eukprot:COSAG05_NODE_6222_length_996_cov_1.183946_1_plen_329_part_01
MERASIELSRQQEMKTEMESALDCLESDNGPQAVTCCKNALRLEQNEKTREREALRKLLEVCESWVKGDVELNPPVYHYQEAEDAYQESEKAANEASRIVKEAGDTGYWRCSEQKVKLREKTRDMLDKRKRRATEEIQAKQSHDQKLKDAQGAITDYRVYDALKDAESALDHANAPDEKTLAQSQMRKAVQEKSRQQHIVNSHSEAIAFLANDNPGHAKQCYVVALEHEPADRPREGRALENLRQLCESWEEGNLHLTEWSGKQALEAFQRCLDLSDDTDVIPTSTGSLFDPFTNDGVKIYLSCPHNRAAKEELQMHKYRATDDIKRK